jgi:hypothetical protein
MVRQNLRIAVLGAPAILPSPCHFLTLLAVAPLDQQPERLRTPKPGTITMKESLHYNCTLAVSTNIVGVDNVKQLEENVKWASEFSPLSPEQMEDIEYKTLPIVRQGLYFRRWDLGA